MTLSHTARHSRKDPNWCTPRVHVDLARTALSGHIDLDPFSSDIANNTVGATSYLTPGVDAFTQQWIAETLFINPPGLQVKAAWKYLMEQMTAGNFKRAIFLGFSVEQLCLLADVTPHPLDFSCCILRKRIAFVREDGTPGNSPSHGNYVCALGVGQKLFAEVYAPLGHLTHGIFAVDA